MREFFLKHDHPNRPGRRPICSGSFQVAAEESKSVHHDHLALCPGCKQMNFTATGEEIIKMFTETMDDLHKREIVMAQELACFKLKLANLEDR